MKMTSLEWDSKFFGLRIARLEVFDDFDEKFLATNVKKEFDLLYVHSPGKLQNFPIPYIDEKVTFHRKVEGIRLKTDEKVKLYEGECSDKLIQLAIQSGEFSRFFLDKKLSEKFEELYSLWMINSVKGILADFTYVYQEGETILGFVTIKKYDDKLQIGLIATDFQSRGKGIGTMLLQKVEEVALAHQINEIIVVTQGANVNACNFYKKNNFSVCEKEYIYHFWI